MIRNYLKRYGLSGVWVYLKVRQGRTQKLSVPGLLHPVRLRNKTSDVPIFHDIFLFGEYDIPLDFTPDTILDIGANVGLTTVYFANRYPGARIISVEPESENFDVLEQNTAAYTNVLPLNRAISNKGGQLIHVVDKGFGEWGFMTSKKDPAKEDKIKGTVKTVTVPEIMDWYELQTVDVVKIDVEGAEMELFEDNYQSWISRARCIIIELHDRMRKGCSRNFFNAISKFDFSYFHSNDNLVFINNDENFDKKITPKPTQQKGSINVLK